MAAEAPMIAFDTLKAVRRLEGAGMSRGHAEAVAETVAAAQGSAATKADIRLLADDIRRLEDKMTTMATKEDLAKLEAATKAEIARLEASTKAEIAKLQTSTKAEIAKLETSNKADNANLELRLVRTMWMQAGAIVAIIVALLKFLQ